jgi:hypothetical protein
MEAEILDDQDGLVVPPFTVPTREPVALPAGEYRVRLSSPGTLSETYRFLVERGQEHDFRVESAGRELWAPITAKQAGHLDVFDVIDLDGRADVIVRAPGAIRRQHGGTGETLWEVKLDACTLPAGQGPRNWPYVLTGGQIPPALVRPAVDLDGVPVLLWACQDSPLLLAVSGKDGKVLWRYEGLGGEFGRFVGQPAVADLGGAVGRVAVVLLNSGSGPTDLIAVSIRTGRKLWGFALGRPVTGFFRAEAPFRGLRPLLQDRPEVIRVNDRQIVVQVLGETVVGLDLATGKPAWPAHDLGFRPLRPPQIADLDGDGQPDLLLVRPRSEAEPAGLMALSLQTRAPLWEKPFPTDDNSDLLGTGDPDWPLLVDLDGDGKPEVVIPITHIKRSGMFTWKGVEVLDGDTGQRRWRRVLSLDSGWRTLRGVRTMLAGPDLDGDGVRDFFVAFTWVDYQRRNWLVVEALSGHDGRSLWTWRRLLANQQLIEGWPVGTMRLWQPGSDGWPQLVVPLMWHPENLTFVLSSGNGRLEHFFLGSSEVGTADLNGDGIPDLYFLTWTQSGLSRLHGLRGTAPDAWRWLAGGAAWRPVPDRDGDGIPDWVREEEKVTGASFPGPPVKAALISGRTGRVLARQRPHLGGTEERQGQDQLGGFRAILGKAGEPIGKKAPASSARFTRWSPTKRLSPVLSVRPNREAAPSQLVLADRSTIFGVDGRTDTARWRCDLPEAEMRSGEARGFTLIFEDSAEGSPWVVFPCRNVDFTGGRPASERWAVIARRALPVRPTGEYMLPEGQSRQYDPLPDDPRWVRPLPWVQPRKYMWQEHSPYLPGGGILVVLGFGVFSRRWRVLVWLLGSLLVISVFLAATGLYWTSGAERQPLLPEQRYSWSGWYQIGWYGAYYLGWLALAWLALKALALSWNNLAKLLRT